MTGAHPVLKAANSSICQTHIMVLEEPGHVPLSRGRLHDDDEDVDGRDHAGAGGLRWRGGAAHVDRDHDHATRRDMVDFALEIARDPTFQRREIEHMREELAGRDEALHRAILHVDDLTAQMDQLKAQLRALNIVPMDTPGPHTEPCAALDEFESVAGYHSAPAAHLRPRRIISARGRMLLLALATALAVVMRLRSR